MDKSFATYPTPTCPDNHDVEGWPDADGSDHAERDLADWAVTMEANVSEAVRVAPMTLVGGWFFFGAFGELWPKFITALGVRNSVASKGARP